MNGLLVGLVLSATLFGVGAVAHTKAVPHIVSQRSEVVPCDYGSSHWDRYIYISDPLDKPVFVYIECESHLTTSPIGILPHRVTEVVLPDIPPQEQCLLNHWLPMKQNQSPPEWKP